MKSTNKRLIQTNLDTHWNVSTNPVGHTTATAVPRFVRSVYDMLQNEDQRILSWSVDGSHFQVYDVPRLETEVLRKYFKHGKFSSFQRQLNNFGFHKWTKTRASVATFSHDLLVRCYPSELASFSFRPQIDPPLQALDQQVVCARISLHPEPLVSSLVSFGARTKQNNTRSI